MRIDSVVVNSSPLILLFKSKQAELLPQLFSKIIVPQQVYKEIMASDKKDPAKAELENVKWIERKNVKILLSVAAWNLGEGESGVFSFALENKSYRAVVDDLAARRCARAFGIKTIGTGGILLLAKRRGLIKSVEERINRLIESGLYISDSIIKQLLYKAGER